VKYVEMIQEHAMKKNRCCMPEISCMRVLKKKKNASYVKLTFTLACYNFIFSYIIRLLFLNRLYQIDVCDKTICALPGSAFCFLTGYTKQMSATKQSVHYLAQPQHGLIVSLLIAMATKKTISQWLPYTKTSRTGTRNGFRQPTGFNFLRGRKSQVWAGTVETENRLPPGNNIAVCHSVTWLSRDCIIPKWRD
jgi:hypothetical protein